MLFPAHLPIERLKSENFGSVVPISFQNSSVNSLRRTMGGNNSIRSNSIIKPMRVNRESAEESARMLQN